MTSPAGPPAYTTILFDLFDTLVRFERSRLPAAWINGREVRSSVPRLFTVAAPALPGVTLETFHAAVVWSYQEAERLRALDHREIPAARRFALAFERLGADAATVAGEVIERLLTTHMGCLAEAAESMPGRGPLLDWLAGRYRLGLVSNFDYTPTVERILRQDGVRDRFETVVVSDGVGWRKPSPEIFEVALQRLAVRAGECLFVGDRPDLDVLGAKGVGMGAAWLNPDGAALPEGVPAPDVTVASLDELRQVLQAGRMPRSRSQPGGS